MKKILSALLAVTMLASIAASNVTAASAPASRSAAVTDQLWSKFETPPYESKSRPLWFWNDSLENTTKEQIREIMVNSKEKSGYFGFGILPNWINNYMTDEYLDLYEYALQTAEELGMKMCLYDENGFPSGRAGGLLGKTYPESTLKRLDKQEKDVEGPANVWVPIPTGEYRTYLGAVAMNTDTHEVIDISDKVVYATEEIPGVYASSSHPAIGNDSFTADKAFDGDYNTRWNAGQNQETDQWLEIRYPQETTVDKVVLREALNRINSYAIQYYDGTNWVDISTGTSIGASKEIVFDAPVTAKKFRLMIYTTTESLASIYEMELFNGSEKIATPEASAESIDRIVYDVPEGNWKIMAFATVKDGDDLVDFLSADAVDNFIEITHQKYYDTFPEYFGTVIDSAFYDEPPLYRAQGRTWTGEFNKMFEEENGFNPITLYPSLWYDMGDATASARNALLSFRAELFARNYIGNMNDWCNEHGIQLTGHMDQEENVNPVTSDGDLMKCFKYQDIPGVDEISSYDRARKAYKVVSSSANNWDKGLVMTETYGAMGEGMGIPVMYKDIMNQFAKGINFVVPHAIWHNNQANVQAPPELSWRSAQYGPELANYNNFIGRTSGLLQNGRHVADIGVLYPIDTLQAGFVFDVGNPYTGNITPEEADYMEVGDLLSATLRKDFTFLHPEVIQERCTVEGDTFKLNNEVNYENYKVIILPGSKTISWEVLQKVRAFYDNGGKVISTTQLPYMSTEPGHDQDVIDTIKYMFGVDEDTIYQTSNLTYSASSFFQNNPQYAADKAFDGVASLGSRWNAGDLSGGDQWLEVDFGEPTTVDRTVITESAPYRVTQYHVQYWNGTEWVNCAEGTSIGDAKTDTFAPVTTTKLRLYVDTIVSDSVSIQEFEVYNGDSRNLALPANTTADNSNEAGGRAIYVGKDFRSNLGPALDQMVDTFDVDIDDVSTQGGDLTYIHKVQEGNDVYYFANSSDNTVNTYVNINKVFENPMVWDPHTGTKYAPEYTVSGDVTRIKLDINAAKSVFILDEKSVETPPVEGVDKTILEKVITYAENAKKSDEFANAIPSVQASFDAALTSAKEILADASAQQTAVDGAWAALMTEIHKLGFQKGDKSALQIAYDAAVALNLDLYQDGAAKDTFIAARDEAKKVLDNPDAMQAEIDKAESDLINASNALVLQQDKTQLEVVVRQATKIAVDLEDKYVTAGQDAFKAALDKANETLLNPDATQAQIDQAVLDLIDAMLNLRLKADKSLLKAAVETAQQMNLDGYTPESINRFNAALNRAQDLLDNPELSTDDNAKIAAAINELEIVSKELATQTAVEGDSQVTANAGAPKTGDSSSLPFALAVAAVALTGAVLYRRKRK